MADRTKELIFVSGCIVEHIMANRKEKIVEWLMVVLGIGAIVGGIVVMKQNNSPAIHREMWFIVLLGLIAVVRGALWLINGRK